MSWPELCGEQAWVGIGRLLWHGQQALGISYLGLTLFGAGSARAEDWRLALPGY